MDLKAYYHKIRDLEQKFSTAHPVVVSHETPEGGIAGVMTEAPARTAARLIVEGRARAANEQETKEFQDQKTEAKRIADQLEASTRMQVTVVSESDLRALKGSKSITKQ
jgi:hypothetical protein